MTSQTGSDLLERAHAWAAEDPDDQTRAELEAVLAAAGSGDEARTGSPAPWSSVRRDCAARSAPARTG